MPLQKSFLLLTWCLPLLKPLGQFSVMGGQSDEHNLERTTEPTANKIEQK